jgi:hypothetical protein
MTNKYCMAVCLLLVSANAGAEIHQCTGEDGVVQFQERPCDDTTSSFKPLTEPAAGASTDQRLDKTRKLLRAYEDERRQQREQDEQEKAEKARRTRNCHRARDYLQGISMSGSVYRMDDRGERIVLSDSERERAIDQARREVAEWCD